MIVFPTEPVSVPELKFLSPPTASCSGGSVSVSCESVQGSLPIQYTWYEKTPSEDSKISDTNKLDLHCQSFTQQHHQYYCTASNNQGEKSSEMVTVSVIHISENDCSYVTQISNIGKYHFKLQKIQLIFKLMSGWIAHGFSSFGRWSNLSKNRIAFIFCFSQLKDRFKVISGQCWNWVRAIVVM